MRADDVILAVRDVVQADFGKIGRVVTSLRGGWEGWLQVEGALNLIARLGVGATANREEAYPAPDNAKRADLVLHPRQGTAIYVELKVQNAFPDDILTRFRADIAKITGLSGATKRGFVIVALAYMQVFDPATLSGMRTIVGGTLLVQPWDGAAWRDTTNNPINAPGNTPPTLASFKLV